MNNLNIAFKKLEELSNSEFYTKENEILKNEILSLISEGKEENFINSKIQLKHQSIISQINENSYIQIISKNKSDEDIEIMIDELINDLKDQGNKKKIESLEEKLINNLDENSFSELIKLKSQLNRE